MKYKKKSIVSTIEGKKIDLLLTILSIIQGLAVTRLYEIIFTKPNGFEFTWHDMNFIFHALICFLIIIRLFETIFLAFIDYNKVVESLYEIILIFMVGAFEYWVIESLNDFSFVKFYERISVLSILTIIGYSIATFKISRGKNKEEIFKGSPYAYKRELKLQTVNVIIPLIILIISIFVLQDFISSEPVLTLLALGISLLITFNIIISWLYTIYEPNETVSISNKK
jgi:hypothetical protein